MGLLDDILGAAGGGQKAGGGAAGAISDLIGGHAGGLGGLVAAFDKSGLGDLAKSWVGTGANLPVSAAQIEAVLGQGPIGEMARKLGVDPATAAGQISELLPKVIDGLTPNGQLPSGGLGDLLGKLGR